MKANNDYIKRMTKYNQAFKQMAIVLLDSGKSSEQVGLELGIGHDTARKWKNKQVMGATSFSASSLDPSQHELAQLRKELREVKLERDILKKAVSIFSKTDGKSTRS